ncbi:MAG TPA: hypothetical protein VFQ62_13040 [Methylomirabilota bacterium]|nr:hypothetical protein [Methylomirabilota bacterium]
MGFPEAINACGCDALMNANARGVIVRLANFRGQDLHAGRAASRQHVLKPDRLDGARRIPDIHDPPDLGNDLLQQLEPLRRELGRNVRQAGDVAAGTRQAIHEADLVGVRRHRHDDRNRLRHRLCSPDCLSTGRDDNVDPSLHELRGQLRQPLGYAFRPPLLQREIAAIDVAQVAECLPEDLPRSRVLIAENADPPDFGRRLLRASGKR